MKTLISIGLVLISINISLGQRNYLDVCVTCNNLGHYFDFNTSNDSSAIYLEYDTIQTNNLWQIGAPSKAIFNYGYLQPRALVTDSINVYPENNISSFQFSLINCSYGNWGVNCGGSFWGPYFDIIHRIETDQGMDGGTIEISHDNGLSWTNLITDSMNGPYISSGAIYTLNDTVASLGQPGYSGSVGWDLLQLQYYPGQFSNGNDTITVRFTFASDSIPTARDGWMIGFIGVQGIFEGVAELISSELFSVYPNPADQELILLPNKKLNMNGELTIFDCSGRIVLSYSSLLSATIDISTLGQGLYFLKYREDQQYSSLKFLKR
jgi:hypothetical protein